MHVVALSEIQGQKFEEPTIVIAETVGGMEDIPVQSHAQTFAVPAPHHLEQCMLTHIYSKNVGTFFWLNFILKSSNKPNRQKSRTLPESRCHVCVITA